MILRFKKNWSNEYLVRERKKSVDCTRSKLLNSRCCWWMLIAVLCCELPEWRAKICNNNNSGNLSSDWNNKKPL